MQDLDDDDEPDASASEIARPEQAGLPDRIGFLGAGKVGHLQLEHLISCNCWQIRSLVCMIKRSHESSQGCTIQTADSKLQPF